MHPWQIAISVFTGIGGIDLAAHAAGFHVAVMCEIDPFCQRVLRERFPDAVLFHDVRHISRRKLIKKLYQRGYLRHDPGHGPIVGLLIGGPPCQAASLAGKRQGSADERWLWDEWTRIVGAARPVWNMAENVPGLYSVDAGRGFGDILGSLASLGYDAGWGCWGAGDVGAPHLRERVWILAYASHHRRWFGPNQQERQSGSCGETDAGSDGKQGFVADAANQGLSERRRPGISQAAAQAGTGLEPECQRRGSTGGGSRPAEPRLGGGAFELPAWLDSSHQPAGPGEEQRPWEPPRVATGIKDRVARLKALGNAVVPAQAYPPLKAIADYERGQHPC